MDAKHRADYARRLMDDPVLNEALDALERQAIEDLLRAPFWRDRHRRILADRVRAIRGIREHLRAVITAGETRARRTVA